MSKLWQRLALELKSLPSGERGAAAEQAKKGRFTTSETEVKRPVDAARLRPGLRPDGAPARRKPGGETTGAEEHALNGLPSPSRRDADCAFACFGDWLSSHLASRRVDSVRGLWSQEVRSWR